MFLAKYFLLIFILFVQRTIAVRIGCKNEDNDDLDWYVNYKLPKIETRKDIIGEGKAYAYVSSKPRSSVWRLSEKDISSDSSMLGNTLRAYYEDKEGLSYLFYNDEHPAEDSSTVGHTKGVVIFDGETGFWLIHSIPKFPSLNKYDYPCNGLENGQSVLCVTFNIGSLNEIGKQLLFNAPSIFEKQLNEKVANMLDEDVKSLFSDNPSFVRKAPFFRITTLRSLGKTRFRSFAKDNQFGEDIYSKLIAPDLMTPLIVETWRRGSGKPMDADCDLKYDVLDVLIMNITTTTGRQRNSGIAFSYTEDHSKWAISGDSKKKWICVGDINRMESQTRRGGGALCFQSSPVWTAYQSAIHETDKCPV